MKRVIARKKSKSNNIIVISVADVDRCNRSFHFSLKKDYRLSIKEQVINNLYKECLKK